MNLDLELARTIMHTQDAEQLSAGAQGADLADRVVGKAAATQGPTAGIALTFRRRA